jgi:beta-glucosidase
MRFVGCSGAEGGRDFNTVDCSERRLHDVYLPAFRAAVRAGVATIMASFNTLNGVPAHANRHTLTEILKRDWGFDGFVVSDYTGIAELVAHGVAADLADAGRLAVDAGVDMEMVSTALADHGARLVATRSLAVARIDDAVRRILRIKFRAGLFDRPYIDVAAAVTEPSPADLAAARSVVLLKNTGRLLPADLRVRSIAVVGPLGDDAAVMHGAWAGPGAWRFPAVSMLAGLRAAAPAATVTFTPGCQITGTDTSGFPAAVAAAGVADLVVAVVGEPTDLSGEAASRSDIGLPGAQAQLLAALPRTGRTLAVVLAGRPLVLGDVAGAADAVLLGWHPGIQGGNALADVIFGVVDPGGKLPVTLPRAVGQLPIYYAHENTGRPPTADKWTSKYLDLPSSPLYEFGFGLSYTTFAVSGLAVTPTSAPAAALRAGRAGVEVRAGQHRRPGRRQVVSSPARPGRQPGQPVDARGFTRSPSPPASGGP